MTNASYGKIVGGILAAWFGCAIAASAGNMFHQDPSHPPLRLLLVALAPIALYAVWFSVSQGFRRFIYALDLRTLTAMQSWRALGFGFIALYAYGILPGRFALPAGYGDMAIGFTAPFVALALARPGRKNLFVLWQLLGMLDLIVAVGTAVAARTDYPSTLPMSVLPLSLVPVFGVPLLAILHVISIAQARQWSHGTESLRRAPVAA